MWSRWTNSAKPAPSRPADATYRPADAQIAWHLARFVTHVRGVSTDPVLVRQNWLAAYDFATDRAALFLNEYAKTNDPFGQIGTNSVSVQVTSVVRASDTSFQVKWTEQVFERGSLAKHRTLDRDPDHHNPAAALRRTASQEPAWPVRQCHRLVARA